MYCLVSSVDQVDLLEKTFQTIMTNIDTLLLKTLILQQTIEFKIIVIIFLYHMQLEIIIANLTLVQK